MRVTKTRPTEGQFIAYWEYRGRLWSETYKWVEGYLERYVRHDDDGNEEWTHEGLSYHQDIIFTYVVREV